MIREIPITPAKADAFKRLAADIKRAEDRLALVLSFELLDELPPETIDAGVAYAGLRKEPDGYKLLVSLPDPNA